MTDPLASKPVDQTLTNQCALVTGGSRGIGVAVVKRLASAGAPVAPTYSSSPERAGEGFKAAQAFGVHVLAVQADSADTGAVIAVVERTASEPGGLDMLVNNAGILVTGPLRAFKLTDFDRTLAVSVRAVFGATPSAAAASRMQAGGRETGPNRRQQNPGHRGLSRFAGGGIHAGI